MNEIISSARAAFLVLSLLAAGAALAQEPTAGIYSLRMTAGGQASISYGLVIEPGDGQNTVLVVRAPVHGNVSYPAVITGAPQAFVYAPAAAYTGTDDFIYRVQDGTGDVSFGIITLNVGNITATAGDDGLVVSTGANSFLDIFFNDTGFADPVSFSITQQPAHGSLVIEAPGPLWQSLIAVLYTPTPGYTGPDQFTYQVGDGTDTDTAIVNLAISADSDADEVLDFFDNCRNTVNPGQEDDDGDGVGNACDNCVALANADQLDNEHDGVGNVCDVDDDNDAVLDLADNCMFASNLNQLNADADIYGNLCDGDLNNTGLVTSSDYNLMRSVLNRASSFSALAAAADLNGSGLVTSVDYNLLRSMMNRAPGPSGLAAP